MLRPLIRAVDWFGAKLGLTDPAMAGVRRLVVAGVWFAAAMGLLIAARAVTGIDTPDWIAAVGGAALQGASKAARERGGGAESELGVPAPKDELPVPPV